MVLQHIPTTCITGWITLSQYRRFFILGWHNIVSINLKIRGTENLAERSKSFATERKR
jgi:hypothetical protein